MRGTTGISRSDVIVLLVAVAVVMCSLSATGPAGRRRAREAVCQSHLRQWGAIFEEQVHDNDGQFLPGSLYSAYFWVDEMDDGLKDRKKTRIWLCPEADKPVIDEDRQQTSGSHVFHAWGIYTGNSYGPNGLAGSYGINGYILPIHDSSTYEGGIRGSQGWRDFRTVTNADTVPMFVDALRFDMWPLHTEGPAEEEDAMWSGNNMGRCCINRHNGAVNCLFLDGSVRKVDLKELWTLKWHRSFDTAGPWTKAGGVTAADWPEWIRDFKNY